MTGYDDGYRPAGQSVSLPAAEGALAGTYATTYAYTADGQLESLTLPAAGGLGAETVTTHYDELSIPEWMGGGTGFGAYVSGSTYSAYGQALVYDLGTTAANFVNYSYQYGTHRGVAAGDHDGVVAPFRSPMSDRCERLRAQGPGVVTGSPNYR